MENLTLTIRDDASALMQERDDFKRFVNLIINALKDYISYRKEEIESLLFLERDLEDPDWILTKLSLDFKNEIDLRKKWELIKRAVYYINDKITEVINRESEAIKLYYKRFLIVLGGYIL